jgi:hypothetical protein
MVRENLERVEYFNGPPTPAILDYVTRVDRAYDVAMRASEAFLAGEVAQIDAALKAAGKAPLATSGAKRIDVTGTAQIDEDTEHEDEGAHD